MNETRCSTVIDAINRIGIDEELSSLTFLFLGCDFQEVASDENDQQVIQNFEPILNHIHTTFNESLLHVCIYIYGPNLPITMSIDQMKLEEYNFTFSIFVSPHLFHEAPSTQLQNWLDSPVDNDIERFNEEMMVYLFQPALWCYESWSETFDVLFNLSNFKIHFISTSYSFSGKLI